MASHPRGARIGQRIALSLLLVASLAALTVLYFSTESGHRKLADLLERLVSDNIPGTMTIGKLERIGKLRLVLSDLRFIHPNGTTVLHLERAEVDVDGGHLLRGRLGFHEALTSGGEIVLATDPDGRLSLEAALDYPTPGTGDPKDGFHYRMQSMHVQGLTVVMRVAKDQYLRLRKTSGFVGVVRETTPGVNVRLERIQGELDRELLGAHVELEQVDGEITGKQKRVADMQVKARIGDDQHLSARVRVFDREKQPVELAIAGGGGVQSNLVKAGLKLGSWFTDSVHVETP